MDLLLLHGALGCSQQLIPLANSFSQDFNVYTADFTGHGSNHPGVPFDLECLLEDINKFLSLNNLQKISLFGYSMGGYAAMCYALRFPERVSKIATMGTRYVWDAEIAAKERKMLDPDKVQAKVPAFAATLAQRHGQDNWRANMGHTANFLSELGTHHYLSFENLTQIQHPVLVLSGDRDATAPLQDTANVYSALPNGRLGILPGTGHAIEQVNNALLADLVEGFLG